MSISCSIAVALAFTAPPLLPAQPRLRPLRVVASAGPPPSRFFRVFHESERESFESFESFRRPKLLVGLSSGRGGGAADDAAARRRPHR